MGWAFRGILSLGIGGGILDFGHFGAVGRDLALRKIFSCRVG